MILYWWLFKTISSNYLRSHRLFSKDYVSGRDQWYISHVPNMSTLQREGSPNFLIRPTWLVNLLTALAHIAQCLINHVIFDSQDSSTLEVSSMFKGKTPSWSKVDGRENTKLPITIVIVWQIGMFDHVIHLLVLLLKRAGTKKLTTVWWREAKLILTKLTEKQIHGNQMLISPLLYNPT